MKDYTCMERFLSGKISKMPCKWPSNLGDVDQDGAITFLDAIAIQEYLVNKRTLTDEQKLLADTNQNGQVDIFDESCIELYSTDKSEIPCD